jgi:hypothetical protein
MKKGARHTATCSDPLGERPAKLEARSCGLQGYPTLALAPSANTEARSAKPQAHSCGLQGWASKPLNLSSNTEARSANSEARADIHRGCSYKHEERPDRHQGCSCIDHARPDNSVARPDRCKGCPNSSQAPPANSEARSAKHGARSAIHEARSANSEARSAVAVGNESIIENLILVYLALCLPLFNYGHLAVLRPTMNLRPRVVSPTWLAKTVMQLRINGVFYARFFSVALLRTTLAALAFHRFLGTVLFVLMLATLPP